MDGTTEAYGSSESTSLEEGEACAEIGQSMDSFDASNNIPPVKDAKKRRTILARQTAIHNPMLVDAVRRTRLGLKGGEVEARLKFSVPKDRALRMSSVQDDSHNAGSKIALCRRFEGLHPSRKEDDASYFGAVAKGMEVTLVTALPADWENGGWRCHGGKSCSPIKTRAKCLHPNRPDADCCIQCQSPKLDLRPEFAHLRLLLPGMRRQRTEYERIIFECDSDLRRCDAAEQEALDRIAAFEVESGKQKVEANTSIDASLSSKNDTKDLIEDTNAEEELIMITDLVQSGSFQRVNARSLLPMLATRKAELNRRLTAARVDLAILVQAVYEMAVPHAQRVARRFLVRNRLDSIRQSVLDLARYAAAVEIQRIIRSKLAVSNADRLRNVRDRKCATKIQSIARRKFAIDERRRLKAIYIRKLRNKSAVILQSMWRCHACKRRAQILAEEKRRQIEAAEKARVGELVKDSATIIQKHWRRMMAIATCKNRRIELGLHTRLLMYLERYAVDGCMWSFVKSINDDYLRFERTISHTIEREEKMAQTFVQKVIAARDGDHASAWENYIKEMKPMHAVPQGREGDTNNNHGNAMKVYGSRSSQIALPRKAKSRRVRPASKENVADQVQQFVVPEKGAHCDVHESRPRSTLDLEARRLSRAHRAKDKLRGMYLRFDVPEGVDDTAQRFILAVMLRYKFEDPGDSSLHGNFEMACIAKEHQHRCMSLAEPLVQRLHEQGIVFIRDMLPAEKMGVILSDMNVGEEFIALSYCMLEVLQQISGGNYFRRKYLMSKCRHVLAQNTTESQRQNEVSLSSFLGECGQAGADSYDDDDKPGGIWKPARAKSGQMANNLQPFLTQSHQKKKGSSSKSWVIPYTAKIISKHESKHPALALYRRGQLLDRNGVGGEDWNAS